MENLWMMSCKCEPKLTPPHTVGKISVKCAKKIPVWSPPPPLLHFSSLQYGDWQTSYLPLLETGLCLSCLISRKPLICQWAWTPETQRKLFLIMVCLLHLKQLLDLDLHSISSDNTNWHKTPVVSVLHVSFDWETKYSFFCHPNAWWLQPWARNNGRDFQVPEITLFPVCFLFNFYAFSLVVLSENKSRSERLFFLFSGGLIHPPPTLYPTPSTPI